MQTHISSMTRILRLTLLVAMLMTAGAAGATKYVREPTMEDLAQVWIGTVPKGILEFFRLELDDKGVGLLTVQYLPQEPARAYRVRRTTLAKYEVRFVLEPLGADAEPVYLRGQAIPGSLDLEIGGTNGNWKRPVFLEVEGTYLARLKAVTDAAAKRRGASQ